MRILFFIEGLKSGGKERRAVELIKKLCSEGHELKIVVTEEEIHFKEIFNLDISIDYVIRNRIKKDPSVFYRFFKIVRQFNPEIIHTWGVMTTLYSIPSKILLRKKLINSFISNAPSKLDIGMFHKWFLFKFSDKILANSNAGVLAYNPPLKKTEVIYNGFDITRLNSITDCSVIKNKYSIKGSFIIGMVANFSFKKDYSTYISSAIELVKKHSELCFLCIGDGDSSKYLKLVNQNKVTNNILFLGKCNDVESIVNVCNIGVLTSYNEGISNALMEFMALSKPVIATTGGGTNELVEDGKSGFIINQKTPEQLVDRIEYLYFNKKEATCMGEFGKKRIDSFFNMSLMIKKFENVYKELVEK